MGSSGKRIAAGLRPVGLLREMEVESCLVRPALKQTNVTTKGKFKYSGAW